LEDHLAGVGKPIVLYVIYSKSNDLIGVGVGREGSEKEESYERDDPSDGPRLWSGQLMLLLGE